ncbi:hypothetical protein PQO03_18070 [Lentisphaera profundi]|uniref:Uncharacterized protein n=1 Tax=Lentisphaera profundi TaxID=1658616 RepID=A0ABY7VX11_9BACT|nr:hypothetical protein [Lentisphaera profundi]WDE97735.1 hypothetical protein PQO03_18070 [Lentisphaera profundi]
MKSIITFAMAGISALCAIGQLQAADQALPAQDRPNIIDTPINTRW